MRKEFRKTGLRLDESGNVYGSNGNLISPFKGLYLNKYTIEEIKEYCFPDGKTFVAEVEKQLLETHIKPNPVKTKKDGKGLRDQIVRPMRSATQSKNKGNLNANFIGYFIIDGVKYDSLREAHKATKMKPETISKCCKWGMSFEPK